VRQLNFHRRHLNAGQAAAAILERQELIDRCKADAKQRQHEGQKAGGRTAGRGRKKIASPSEDRKAIRQSRTTSAQLAKAVGVSPSSIERTKKLRQDDEKAYQAVKHDKVKLARATREVKAAQMRKRVSLPNAKGRATKTRNRSPYRVLKLSMSAWIA
jgi:hypothetical protein